MEINAKGIPWGGNGRWSFGEAHSEPMYVLTMLLRLNNQAFGRLCSVALRWRLEVESYEQRCWPLNSHVAIYCVEARSVHYNIGGSRSLAGRTAGSNGVLERSKRIG